MNGLLEKQQRQNLFIRILLHRACASITIIVVALSVLCIDYKAYVAWGVLVLMLLFEFFFVCKYSPIRKKALLRPIANLFELKDTVTEYPRFPLLLEAIALTFLCTISGGINSPFLSLFAIFSVLGLYVLGRRSPLLAAVDIFVLCLCFLLILGGEFLLVKYKAFFLSYYLTTEALLERHPIIFLLIIVYSIIMSGITLYMVAKSYAEQQELAFERPFRETQEFLKARKIHFPIKNNRVFVIGNKALNPKGTLALLPYCSRGLLCPIRADDEKKPAEIPTTTDGCQQCDNPCHIGKLFKLKGGEIAELKIIGTSHKIDDVVDDFCKNGRQLTHVIAVCCTSNLARYLKSEMAKHENVTVIYTPLIPGDRICVSSIDPAFDRRTLGPLPCTSFDSDALISYLQK